MKYIGKPNFCLGMQIKYFPNGMLVHQSSYTKSLKALIYIILKKKTKKYYLSEIDMMYFPNYTILQNNIFFQFANKIKFCTHVKTLEYDQTYTMTSLWIIDVCLFYLKLSESQLLRRVNVSYLQTRAKFNLNYLWQYNNIMQTNNDRHFFKSLKYNLNS